MDKVRRKKITHLRGNGGKKLSETARKSLKEERKALGERKPR